MQCNTAYLKTISGMLKIAEMVSVFISFGILRGTNVNFDVDIKYIGIGILFCCMLVTPLLLTCYLMGRTEIQHTILEFTLNFLFFFFLALFGVMGMIDVNNFPKGSTRNSVISMCFFALVASVAYLMDTIMAIKNYRT